MDRLVEAGARLAAAPTRRGPAAEAAAYLHAIIAKPITSIAIVDACDYMLVTRFAR